MTASTPDIKNLGGRPRTGIGTPVMVRLQPDQLGALDQWIANHETAPSRPEAIRQLLEQALKP
ncbi:hypothetical protein EAH84_07125 [Sphingomonas oligophenolica]|uniref:Ribbon-helix-helix protein, CopG family n=1 Tax=Sphingomonas oligophenolica TaxID=301154 RepID=A0A502CKM3_9SPHN|nr:hypothetical protein EAH84_07125 [Sphingomonas oligophenolica]